MENKKTTKKHLKLRKKRIFQLFSIVVMVLSFIFSKKLISLNILPSNYLIIFISILTIINIILFLLLSLNKITTRLIGTLLSFSLIFIFTVGINYQNITLSFLHNLNFLNIQTENYNIITLKNGSYRSLKDLENKKIAYVNGRESITKLEQSIKKQINYKKQTYNNIGDLIDNLLGQKVDAIVMEQEEKDLYMEMLEEFKSSSTVIDTLSIDTYYDDSLTKDVEITTKPFNIYLTGIDTYKSINSVSRSDVNIILTINPNTHKILITSIPRDYYVKLHGIDELNDKLTHAGLHGVDMSIKTIEDLLDININYYAKVNFTSLINIVDEVGGLDIDNPFAFDANYQEEDGTYVKYSYEKGLIHLDGKEALAYSRERHNLREGDVARARHQQLIIKAIIDKCMSSTILTKYASIIGGLEGNFVTNMKLDSITSLIQEQIKTMPKWEVKEEVLTGTNDSKLTYTFPKSYAYVMIPDEESVKASQDNIKEILK